MTDFTLHEGFPNIRLPAGTQLRLIAIDPTTGNSVGGVTSTNWAIYGDDQSEPATAEPPLPVLILPVGSQTV